MGRKAAFAIAAALITLPSIALVGYKHWLDTRVVVPLNVPVSLSRGHIRTQKFFVNLKGQYSIEVRPDPPFGYFSNCLIYGRESVLKTQFRLSGTDNALPKLSDSDEYSYFEAKKEGQYWLDLDVLSDASCLNAGHPRLLVQSDGFGFYSDLYGNVSWVCLVVILIGLGLCGFIAVGTVRASHEETHLALNPDAASVGANLEPLRHPLAKPISALPHFGLFCGSVLALVVFVMMVLTADIPPKGIYVSLKVPPVGTTAANSAAPPVVVLVRAVGKPPFTPKLYVNSKPVEWDGLKDELKQQLKLRAEWVVYVDGDSNLAFGDVAAVASKAKELHAKVILITPQTRRLVEPESAGKIGKQR